MGLAKVAGKAYRHGNPTPRPRVRGHPQYLRHSHGGARMKQITDNTKAWKVLRLMQRNEQKAKRLLADYLRPGVTQSNVGILSECGSDSPELAHSEFSAVA